MSVGRKRAFDKEKALADAMVVFWRNGYAGTSLTELTQSMGINKPSMYAAFGNKEQLFMAALKQYMEQYGLALMSHLFAPNRPFAERLETYLQEAAKFYSRPDLPSGCMMASSSYEASGDGVPAAARELVTTINHTALQQLTEFFTQEQNAGSLKTHSSPRSLALYIMSVTNGMSSFANSGATAEDLNGVISHVMTTFA